MQLNFNPLNGGFKSFNPLNQQDILEESKKPQESWKMPDRTQQQINDSFLSSPGDIERRDLYNKTPDLPEMKPPTEPPPETEEEKDGPALGEVSTETGANPLLMALGGGFGVLNGVLENQQKNEELRRREIEVEQAIGQNASEREKIELMNPNANMRAKMGMLQSGKSQAMQQAANVGGANVTSSGLGGDVDSAKIAAMKASGPMAQVSAGYDQQMAGTVDQRSAEENQQIGQLSNNTAQRGQLSQMTDYINEEQNKNPISGILSSALTGMTGLNIMGTMMGKTKTEKLTPEKQNG